jgi:hypothetical protein
MATSQLLDPTTADEKFRPTMLLRCGAAIAPKIARFTKAQVAVRAAACSVNFAAADWAQVDVTPAVVVRVAELEWPILAASTDLAACEIAAADANPAVAVDSAVVQNAVADEPAARCSRNFVVEIQYTAKPL